MKTGALLMAAFGVVYIIYSLVDRKNISPWVVSSEKYDIQNEKYIPLQLVLVVLNTLVIFAGAIILYRNIKGLVIVIICPILFVVLNLIVFMVSRKVGFLKKR